MPYLQQIAPWGAPPPDGGVGKWNALTWDAAAYFGPSRQFAARSLRADHVPLWNPYELGGTPFLANAQSAVLYPPGFLFWLLPTAHAFAANAWLHLFLFGLFAYLWLRAEGLPEAAAGFTAAALQLSGWTVVWLELPTFLQVVTWLPLLLWVLRASLGGAGARRPGLTPPRATALGGLSVAFMVLAGHFQLAFYALLTAALYLLVWVLPSRQRLLAGPPAAGGQSADDEAAAGEARLAAAEPGPHAVAGRALGIGVAALLLGLLMASAQLLPSAEMARWGHRQETPTAAGYAALARQAMAPTQLVRVVMPDFYGNPSGDGYWGPGQQEVAGYTEFCAYLGVLPLLLVPFGLLGWRESRLVRAAVLVAAVGWLLALGTPINAPLYFLMPGFATFGTPSRALVMAVFGGAVLAGCGLQRLLRGERGVREVRTALLALLLLALGTAAVTAVAVAALPPPLRASLGALEARSLLQLLGLAALGGALVTARAAGKVGAQAFGAAAVGVLVLDLASFGLGYPPTGPASSVYPPTDLTAFLRGAGLNRVLFINPDWPLHRTPVAVLPPNLPMAYDLHFVGGYESLYLRSYKEALNRLQGRDTSPPTNGNLVMPTEPAEPLLRQAAVRYVVSLRPLDRPYLRPVLQANGALVYEYAGWQPRPRLETPSGPRPVRVRYQGPNGIEALLPGREGVLRDQNVVPPIPGWRAWRLHDGRRGTTLLAPGGGIPVPPGTTAAGWEYRPESYQVGLFLSLVGVALMSLLLTLGALQPAGGPGADR